jgi:aryl-alcohol dehydrogenase-like predicted oxidoreductase
MALPDEAYLQFAPDVRICRLLTGMWQVSGVHGRIDPAAAVAAMVAYHDAGYTTWDLADHYGPAEDLIGAFRRRLANSRGAQALSEVQAFTKWVPAPGRITRRMVEDAVARSCRRMGVDALDLLQFHWWEYDDPGYLDALEALAHLQRGGAIRHLALTNFDTDHLRLLVERGLPIVSNQVQYSLIDRRPEVHLAAYCRRHGISLLAYGTLGGGLLSERYLGRPEPAPASLSTASLQKYKRMVDAWGGWGRFQRLLAVIEPIAKKHRVSLANVAVRYVLDRPAVAGVIVGARLGVADHVADNTRVFGLRLDAADLAAIENGLADARDLYRLIGDCGAEYRR